MFGNHISSPSAVVSVADDQVGWLGRKLGLVALWRGSFYRCVYVNQLVAQWEAIVVKQGKGKQETVQLDAFYFVNVGITAMDWPLVEAEFPTVEGTLETMGALLLEGMKLSFSYNPQNLLTVCSLTDKREGSPTRGACLTGGADGWYDAFRVVLWKYLCVLKGDLSRESQSSGGSVRLM